MNYYDFKRKVEELGFYVVDRNAELLVYESKKDVRTGEYMVKIDKLMQFEIDNTYTVDRDVYLLASELAATPTKERHKELYLVIKQNYYDDRLFEDEIGRYEDRSEAIRFLKERDRVGDTNFFIKKERV